MIKKYIIVLLTCSILINNADVCYSLRPCATGDSSKDPNLESKIKAMFVIERNSSDINIDFINLLSNCNLSNENVLLMLSNRALKIYDSDTVACAIDAILKSKNLANHSATVRVRTYYILAILGRTLQEPNIAYRAINEILDSIKFSSSNISMDEKGFALQAIGILALAIQDSHMAELIIERILKIHHIFRGDSKLTERAYDILGSLALSLRNSTVASRVITRILKSKGLTRKNSKVVIEALYAISILALYANNRCLKRVQKLLKKIMTPNNYLSIVVDAIYVDELLTTLIEEKGDFYNTYIQRLQALPSVEPEEALESIETKQPFDGVILTRPIAEFSQLSTLADKRFETELRGIPISYLTAQTQHLVFGEIGKRRRAQLVDFSRIPSILYKDPERVLFEEVFTDANECYRNNIFLLLRGSPGSVDGPLVTKHSLSMHIHPNPHFVPISEIAFLHGGSIGYKTTLEESPQDVSFVIHYNRTKQRINQNLSKRFDRMRTEDKLLKFPFSSMPSFSVLANLEDKQNLEKAIQSSS